MYELITYCESSKSPMTVSVLHSSDYLHPRRGSHSYSFILSLYNNFKYI